MRHHHPAYQSKRRVGTAVLVGLTAMLLAGCETSGPTNPITELAAYRVRAQEPAASAEKPKSRAQVAMDCWAQAEKSHANASVDARGDFVTKCIDAKLGGTGEAKPAVAARKPKPDSAPEAKPKPSSADKPKT